MAISIQDSSPFIHRNAIFYGKCSINRMKWFRILLALYTLSIGLIHFWKLPLFNRRIQLPEIIFITLFSIWIFLVAVKKLSFPRWGKLEFALLLCLLAQIISAAWHNSVTTWLEVAGFIYIMFIFRVFKDGFSLSSVTWTMISKVLIGAGVIHAALGLSGWVLAYFDIHTGMALEKEITFPYFNNFPRATAFMISPNLLHNLLAICLLLFPFSFSQITLSRPQKIIIYALVIVGIMVCISKNSILLIMALMYLWMSQHSLSKFRQSMMIISIFILFLVYTVGTHFIVLPKESVPWAHRNEQPFFDTKPAYESNQFVVVPTCYWVLKKTSLAAFIESPLTGVGPGLHNDFIKKLKKENQYPLNLNNYDPHSTFLGALAETGIIGFLALMYLVYHIWKILFRNNTRDVETSPRQASFQACFLFMALDAINMDILHFRHLWILAALVVIYSIPEKQLKPIYQKVA